MSRTVTQTARLRLRTEAEGDQAIWLAHMNVPAVMANLGGPQTEEQVAAKFARMAGGWAEDGFSFMLVERASDSLLIGHCGLSRILTACAPPVLARQVQIGWLLRADAWGQGYAREAAQGVLALAFGALGMERIWAQTSESNRGSWGLMERLGMTRRADLDYPDPDYPPEDNPTMVYELSREAWRAASA